MIHLRAHMILSITAITAILNMAQIVNLTVKQTFGFDLDPGSNYPHSEYISRFCATHPGRYAMGDKAGMVAYLSERSVLQLEGLASDLAMVRHIEHQDELTEVLREYSINYIIVSTDGPLKKDTNGFLIQAPNPLQAGENSPKMTAHINGKPLFFYTASAKERERYVVMHHRLPRDTYSYVFSVK